MQDRSWLLRPQAIRVAKECIEIVKLEQGVKLLLSDPEFMQILHEYVEITGSPRLGDAYSRLLAMAGVGKTMRGLRAHNSTDYAVNQNG